MTTTTSHGKDMLHSAESGLGVPLAELYENCGIDREAESAHA